MAPLLSHISLATCLLTTVSQSMTLFPFEQVQLTRAYVDSLPAEDAQLFAFGDQSEDVFLDAAVNVTTPRCRYAPGDGKWPSDKAWTKLAKQLSSTSALIKTIPQSSVCWPGTTSNDAKCQNITNNWSNSYYHIDDPSEILSPIYQGLTCTPPSIYDSGGCTLGGFPSYVIKAQTVLDLQLGLNFARNDGIRLVIRNTGHDFVGKSTGAGALSLWTHALKDMQFFDNYVDDSGYRGSAIKAGSGVQTSELYRFANTHGMMAIAGESETVGALGGYILGGGHSPLSSIYGMAADQVLGFEVIIPSGEFVTANSTSYSDLFWALKGGGGGTFGVVTSVTIKVYKDMPITAATWTIDSSKIGKEKFWAATKAFVDRTLPHVDSGVYSYLHIAPNGTNFSFRMHPFFGVNQTAKQVNSLLAPFFSNLTALNVPLSPRIVEYRSFYSAWQAEFPLEKAGDVQSTHGSRLFPRSNFASETGRNITFAALRQMVEFGQPIVAFQIAPTLQRGGTPDNAVNPAWRNAAFFAITRKSWDVKATASDILAIRKDFSNNLMQRWRDITPGSGSYVNEGDRMEPNWQQAFWGDKYTKLLGIKRNYDAKNVLWAINAVGSEDQTVETADGLPHENGKLCKVDGTVVRTLTPMLRAF